VGSGDSVIGEIVGVVIGVGVLVTV
jgi:hypothetical protein